MVCDASAAAPYFQRTLVWPEIEFVGKTSFEQNLIFKNSNIVINDRRDVHLLDIPKRTQPIQDFVVASNLLEIISRVLVECIGVFIKDLECFQKVTVVLFRYSPEHPDRFVSLL